MLVSLSFDARFMLASLGAWNWLAAWDRAAIWWANTL